MSDNTPATIKIEYDGARLAGRLAFEGATETAIWDRIRQYIVSSNIEYSFLGGSIELQWPVVLSVIREFSGLQRSHNFRFQPIGVAKEKVAEFVAQYRKVNEARGKSTATLSIEEIEKKLSEAGFTKRQLKPFQLRDLQRLLSLPNGANFSVPGAGKTTVALALNLLAKKSGEHFLVICPKAAFPAWRAVVDECIRADAPNNNAEPFTVLTGSADHIAEILASGATRFVINYDLLIQVPQIVTDYLSRRPVHLLLDESHRMKAGARSQRGSFLLGVATLPIRRDILTGTPMPQSASDMQSQLDFLYPGLGLGVQISRGAAPKDVLGNLYVRTTKRELGLKRPNRKFMQVDMAKGQLALYGVVRSEALRDFSSLKSARGINLVGAKRSVMRLLQLSANPLLALRGMVETVAGLDSRIVDQVIAEGPSTKMLAVADLARQLAKEGRKSVIWTIFTDTLEEMEVLLADLNPVTLYGIVPSGDASDLSTREGRLRRFHIDDACKVMIANPAAAGEGISLHQVCHDAIYLDRTYVTTHYLQSIDRIHRLGLAPSIDTNIFIYQTRAPSGLGCIDHSVSRRLGEKIRALQALLDDPDLHEIALDEEEADEPVDYGIDDQDVIDLIEELEGRTTYDPETAEVWS